MRRLVSHIALAGVLLSPVATADAGIGSLLVRAASKVGQVGAKGAKLGKLAKGGAVLKGAKVLGVGVAAERVFLHADDLGRMGVFVADDGAGALKVVMRGGDEWSHSPSSFRSLVDDLDEMARGADGAGVDVFVDESALRRLGDLEVGDRTRLFLANTDGPSWPIRKLPDGGVDVGVGPDAWLRVGSQLADASIDMALRLSSLRLDGAEPKVVVDPDCKGATTPQVAMADAQPGTTLILLGEEGVVEEAELLALAERHGVDVVLLGLADVCPADDADPPTLAEVLGQMARTTTIGELWGVAAHDAAPVVLDRVRDASSHVVVAGQGVISVFGQAGEEVVAEEDLPKWARATLGGLILLGFLGVKGWLARKKQVVAE